MLARSKAARSEALDAAEERALEAGFEAADVRAVMDDVLEEYAPELSSVRGMLESLQALREVLAGVDVESNLELMEEHRFERAQLARLYLEAGLAADDEQLVDRAVEVAREAIEDRDGRLYPYATLAYVLHAAGETEEALEVFDELREWTARADLDLPVFERLAPLAAERGLPDDWRVEPTVRDDVGARGDLAELGPLRWTPPPALDWTLPDAFGNQVSLSDYRGRPVIVIFFLGFGCVHCVEQLQAFGPAYERFAEVGIEMVSIGTDGEDELAEAFGDDPSDTGYPFPVLADAELEHFERYRAYDDFEDMPLHGTFLVDGRGRVRWQDVSYEPFMDWEFLLEESQRLLGLDEAPVTAATPAPATPAPANRAPVGAVEAASGGSSSGR
jgi:peroxiredoxin